jgi:hypothetical protein
MRMVIFSFGSRDSILLYPTLLYSTLPQSASDISTLPSLSLHLSLLSP